MNVIDILLIVVVLLSVWNGWHKGFISGSLHLVTLAGSVVTALYAYPYAAVVFRKYLPSLGVWTLPFSFIIALLLARIVIGAIAGRIISAVPATTQEHTANRILGIVPGFIIGFINAVILSALLLSFPVWDGLSAKTRNSRIAEKLIPPAEWMESKISPVFDEAARQTMNKLTVEPGSDKSFKLPFSVTDPEVRPDLEARMLEMVNEERKKQGLKPLQADPELTRVARSHSRDMLARSYFAHNTPDGKDPFDRMKAAGVRFLTAGENLAMAQTLSIAHNGLMNSPGHRANILRPAFGRVGIGVLDAGMYGLMISQEFRN